jgi:hypothetical protein
LKQLQADGETSIGVDELNDMLAGMGVEAFSYDTFAMSYNSDPQLKKIIKNFNKDEINFQGDSVDALPQGSEGGDTVGKMAKNAVDLSDL